MSNKLIGVGDIATEDGFKDLNTSGNDYEYDINGNMVMDRNKNIIDIKYNHLNLPIEVAFSGENSIDYVYDATGVKLRKTVTEKSGENLYIVDTKTTDYAGNYIYEKSSHMDYSNGYGMGNQLSYTLQFFSQPEGYAEFAGGNNYNYVYQYKDHLGNIRLSYINQNDSYQNILDSDLTNDYDGWVHNGGVTSELINGTLKVDVNLAWEGIKHELPDLTTSPGDVLDVKLDFDKGNTQANVRLYFQELDANGNHLSWNVMNGNLQTGYYEYSYTVNAASRLRLRIDKSNTHTGDLTSFYVKHVSVTSGALEIVEENNYYPFGLKHKGYNNVVSGTEYNYKQYQGQEWTEDLGLNVHEWKYRISDPAIGRFWQVDPLAEDYVYNGVYNFSENRVIDAVELEGLEAVLVIDKDERPQDNGTAGTTYTGETYYLNEETGDVNGPYRSSTYPNSRSNNDNSTKYNTLNEGDHQYNNASGHDGSTKKGLNIDDKGDRRTDGTNPDGEDVTMQYVNYHSGASDRGNYNSRGSAGCITCAPDDAEAFFENFNWTNNAETTGDSSGTITVQRGTDAENRHTVIGLMLRGSNIKINNIKKDKNSNQPISTINVP